MDNVNDMTFDEKATIFYQKHLERMRTYSKNHREKTRETAKKAYQTIKNDYIWREDVLNINIESKRRKILQLKNRMRFQFKLSKIMKMK
jgi:vacuolar-type H+-ATPase subunit H